LIVETLSQDLTKNRSRGGFTLRIIDLEEVVELIRPGSTLMIGGFLGVGTPQISLIIGRKAHRRFDCNW